MNALARTDDAEIVRRHQARVNFLKALPKAERDARSNGEFFMAMHEIWELEPAAITDDDSFFHAICRTEEQGNRLYSQTTSAENLSHPMGQSESSSLTNTVQQSPARFDMFQNNTAEKAHLFSNAPVCHKAYGYLAQAATGKQAETPEKRLKLLNGVKKRGDLNRSHGTGLKHHKFNKMYLERQGDYYDRQPVLITIPIYEINDLLDWNGIDEYDVMAITVGDIAGQSCSEKVLKASPSTCNRVDIEKATEVLRVFYKGIACSVRNHSVGESFKPEQLDFHSTPMTDLKKWWKLKREGLESSQASIQIPKVRSDLKWDEVKVARARASRENSLPDPFNMAVKAAINFSFIVGAKVMPACPEYELTNEDEPINSTQDDDDDDDHSQWPQHTQNVDLSSLLRPVQM